MNAITLSKTSDGWMATYSGPHADEIRELFGTNTIPTAYTANAAPETVLVAIAKLNPGVAIRY